MTELLPLPAQGLPARVIPHVGNDLELADSPLRPELLEGIAQNTAHASAAGTRRTYEGDWSAFERWCDVHGRRALPAQPQTVAGYITDRAALVEPGSGDHVYAPSTISRWVTSINVRHERENLAPPGATRTVKDTLAGIRRDNARPTRRMAPLLLNDLKRVLRASICTPTRRVAQFVLIFEDLERSKKMTRPLPLLPSPSPAPWSHDLPPSGASRNPPRSRLFSLESMAATLARCHRADRPMPRKFLRWGPSRGSHSLGTVVAAATGGPSSTGRTGPPGLRQCRQACRLAVHERRGSPRSVTTPRPATTDARHKQGRLIA